MRAQSVAGLVSLQAARITGDSETHQSQSNDLMTQSMAGSGNISQSLNYTTISLKDNKSPVLNATGGITVGASNLPSSGSASNGGGNTPTVTVDLKQQAQQLSNQPGLAYLGDLAQRNDVAFQKVQLASQSWNYSQSGLSPAGAAIIAIAVAIATYGAGSALAGAAAGTEVTVAGAAAGSTVTTTEVAGVALSTATTTTGVGTVTTYTAAGAALNAGFSSLASQAAVALINNQGDIGKTLQTLGSESSIRNTVAAMLTAGVAQGLADANGAVQVLGKTATACGAGAVSGSGCGGGAVFSALTSTAALGYNSLAGYYANAGPGFNPENPIYEPTASGLQPPQYYNANVIGHNEAGSIWSQGSTLSKILNYVPFVNATAGLHDYLFNAKLLPMDTLTNVGTMIPSAVFAIPASLGNSNLNWIGTTNLNSLGSKK